MRRTGKCEKGATKGCPCSLPHLEMPTPGSATSLTGLDEGGMKEPKTQEAAWCVGAMMGSPTTMMIVPTMCLRGWGGVGMGWGR